MRDQYAGDVSDVLKFAFLRALAGNDGTLGVAWYHAPGDDGRADGRHLEWRDEPAWRLLDAQLHAGLSALPERSIAALERAMIVSVRSRSCSDLISSGLAGLLLEAHKEAAGGGRDCCAGRAAPDVVGG